jgi:hypothetical protein
MSKWKFDLGQTYKNIIETRLLFNKILIKYIVKQMEDMSIILETIE